MIKVYANETVESVEQEVAKLEELLRVAKAKLLIVRSWAETRKQQLKLEEKA